MSTVFTNTDGKFGNSGTTGTAMLRSMVTCCESGWFSFSLITPLTTNSQLVAVTVTTGSIVEFGAYVCVPPVIVVVDCSSPKSIIKLSNVPLTSKSKAIVVPVVTSSEII